MYYPYLPVSELLGKTLVSVKESGDEILFTTDKGAVYKMYHEQDCCENVSIEDISGDLQDLVGAPIHLAEEVENPEIPEGKEDCYESCTWTFYRFATVKGYVTIRWLGTSNGYYSESVSFAKVEDEDAGKEIADAIDKQILEDVLKLKD